VRPDNEISGFEMIPFRISLSSSVCSFDSFYNIDDFSCLPPELLMQVYFVVMISLSRLSICKHASMQVCIAGRY